jgi:hypothetical protein
MCVVQSCKNVLNHRLSYLSFFAVGFSPKKGCVPPRHDMPTYFPYKNRDIMVDKFVILVRLETPPRRKKKQYQCTETVMIRLFKSSDLKLFLYLVA